MNQGGKLKKIYNLSIEKNLVDKNASTDEELVSEISKIKRYLEVNKLSSESTLAKFDKLKEQRNQESANRLAKEEQARIRRETKERAKLNEEDRIRLEKEEKEERLRIQKEESQRMEAIFQEDLKQVEELKMQYKIAGEREIVRVNADCNKKSRKECKGDCFYLNKSNKCLITNKARDKILSDNKEELSNIQVVKDVEREQALRENQNFITNANNLILIKLNVTKIKDHVGLIIRVVIV